MSQENVRVVREAIEAVTGQDLDRLIKFTDPSVEWHSFMAQLGEGGVYRGHDGIRRYVRDLSEAWDFLKTEVNDVLAVGLHAGFPRS